jgi:TIR domain
VPGIFISYRREDSEMAAGRLADGLRPHFGKDQVFVDVVTLRGGEEWAEKIRQSISRRWSWYL